MSSDMQQIEMHNTPEPDIRIEQVGDDRDIVYHVDWEAMKHPTPAMFRDVTSLQVKLAVLPSRIQNETVSDACDKAFEAVTELLHTMIDERDDLDDDQQQDVVMGNLDSLPEVIGRELR